jgi:hypothetical protein
MVLQIVGTGEQDWAYPSRFCAQNVSFAVTDKP